jgi:hypothetical protein
MKKAIVFRSLMIFSFKVEIAMSIVACACNCKVDP